MIYYQFLALFSLAFNFMRAAMDFALMDAVPTATNTLLCYDIPLTLYSVAVAYFYSLHIFFVLVNSRQHELSYCPVLARDCTADFRKHAEV